MRYTVLSLAVLGAYASCTYAGNINISTTNPTLQTKYEGSVSDKDLIFIQTASPENFSKLIFLDSKDKSLTISGYDNVSLLQGDGQKLTKNDTQGALVINDQAVFTLKGNGKTNFNIGSEDSPFNTAVVLPDRVSGGQALHVWGGKAYFDNLSSFYVNTDKEGVMVQHFPKGKNESPILSVQSDDFTVKSGSSSVAVYNFSNDGSSLINIDANNVNVQSGYFGVSAYDTWDKTRGSGLAAITIRAKNSINVSGAVFGVSIIRTVNNSKTKISFEAPVVNISSENAGSKGFAIQIETPDSSVNSDAQVSIKGSEVTLNSSNDTVYQVNGKTTITADKIILNSEVGRAVSLTNGGSLELKSSKGGLTQINGSVNALDSNHNSILKDNTIKITSTEGTISVENQKVVMSEGSTFKTGSLNSAGDSSLVFNTDEKGGVTVNHLNGKIDLVAGNTLTEKYGSGRAVVAAIRDGIFASATEEGEKSLMNNFAGGEASDLTAAWEYNPENGTVTTLGDASGLSPTLVAAKKTAGANLAQWRYEVNHLSERLGEVRNLQGSVGTWARVYGAEAKLEDSVSTKVRGNTIQVGADVRVGDNWIVGGAFGYTDSKADFSNGESSTDSFNLAAYGTAFFPFGGYVDLIARVGRMSTDVDVATVTDFKSSYDNTAFGVSAEVGYRWDISKTFYLTPQAELSYGLVKGADYTAANEIRVDQDDFQTLVGRLGFQAGMNVADGAGSVYLTASVNHDFQGESDAYARRGDSAVQKLSEDLGGTWVSYGFGGQINVKDNWSFYGSLTRANGSDYQENYRYSVGTRYCW